MNDGGPRYGHLHVVGQTGIGMNGGPRYGHLHVMRETGAGMNGDPWLGHSLPFVGRARRLVSCFVFVAEPFG